MRRDPPGYRLFKRSELEKVLELMESHAADIVSVPPVVVVTMEASWFSGAAHCRSSYRPIRRSG